jgi:methylenetetrahydrofolate reductase (NADPH)
MKALLLHVCLTHTSQKEEALKLWGHPTSIEEIALLFSRFCTSDLSALPWSDQAPASETKTIGPQLGQMNNYGFFTINSQPAVNGARSEDKVFGWGPSNGYVYQKVRSFIQLAA